MKKYHGIIVLFIVGLLLGAGFLSLSPQSDIEKPELVDSPTEPENTDTETVSDIVQNEQEIDNVD